jgi:hypothetical protein
MSAGSFWERHGLAILGVERRDQPLDLSPVYFVLDGDLLISVTQIYYR